MAGSNLRVSARIAGAVFPGRVLEGLVLLQPRDGRNHTGRRRAWMALLRVAGSSWGGRRWTRRLVSQTLLTAFPLQS